MPSALSHAFFALPGEFGLPLDLAQSWQQVHRGLTQRGGLNDSITDLFGLATYHYCTYRVFRHRATARLVQRLLTQITAEWGPGSLHALTWSTLQFDQACCLAWLNGRLATEGWAPAPTQTLLANLDHVLQLQAQHLRNRPEGIGRNQFFRVLRYFNLRWPLPVAQAALSSLLALVFPSSPAAYESAQRLDWPAHMPLGLSNGLAAELLTLIKSSRLGISNPAIGEHVRRSIRHLLSFRREADFAEQQYSIFPSQGSIHYLEPDCETEFSWQRGDLGQSLLLYETHLLLQDTELGRMAELIGLNTLLRTTRTSTQIVDSQFHTGSAGVAHLYRRLYSVSGQPAYRTGYRFWLTQTQALLREETDGGDCRSERELLHGWAGVGLVLLSALVEQELGWDDVLLS
jgi:Lanthionine synthetase C-like protein